MTNISKPIIFFGTEDFSLTSLQALIDAGYPVVAVVTKPDMQKGRGHKLTPPPVKLLAQQHAIPVWQPVKLHEVADQIAKFDHPMGVLVSYGKIIPQTIIDLFSPGIINVHPSLLPLYRGPSPIESAILHGDNRTGVSIMKLSAAMDAGPVYRQITYDLSGDETAEQLYEILGHKGAELLVELLPAIADGTLAPTAQDDANATYCQLIDKTNSAIDWNKTAETIERQIRAYHQWPQSRTSIGTVEVIITEAEIYPVPRKTAGTVEIVDGQLLVFASDAAIRIKSIKPIGKKEMPIQAFLAGYRTQVTN